VIKHAGYQSKKTAGEKLLFRFSSFFFTWPVSPSVIYGTLLLHVLLVLLTTTAKKKILLGATTSKIRVELRALLISLHVCARGDLAKSRF